MRDRMERLVVLPFSVGCISDSSVAVAALCDSHKRSSKSHSNNCPPPPPPPQDEEESMKNVFKYLAASKPEISTGIHRLFKSFKTLSHLFAYKEEMEEEEEEEVEIGQPTNVRHVSHIGWESTLTIGQGRASWQDLLPPELLSHHHIPHSPLLLQYPSSTS